MKFYDHSKVLTYRTATLDSEKDIRDEVREHNICWSKRDGFWEEQIANSWDGKPKYSIDATKPKILKLWGELASQDVSISVKASHDGDDETSETYAGLFRSIEFQSGAQDVYARSLKRAMICGMAAAEVDYEFADDYSFNKELFIKAIPDSVNRVWFFGNWESPVASDSLAVTIDTLIDNEEFEEKFPKLKRKAKPLQTDSQHNPFYNRRDGSVISKLYYTVFKEETIYQGPNAEVYKEEDLQKIAALGVDTSQYPKRTRAIPKIKCRWYDAQGWLNDEEDTVFDRLPVVPLLPNFDLVNYKPVYFGELSKVIDEQRILNYATSKYVFDTALAPKNKIWMTVDQALSSKVQSQLKTYNTSSDPVQLYDFVPDQPQPFPMGAPSGSEETAGLIETMTSMIGESIGIFGASEGKQFARQSAEAIEAIQYKGDVGSLEYFNCWKTWIVQLAKIVIGAIPLVYTATMTKRIIGEDGSYQEVELNKTGLDEENNPIKLNDLSKGQYDVHCDIGMAFRSKKEQTARSLDMLSDKDPSIVADNKDIFLSSFDTPGMDKAAERARVKLLRSGVIPQSQWTEEERQEMAQLAQQPQEPSPEEKIAEANLRIADAQATKAETDSQLNALKLEIQHQDQQFKHEIQQLELVAKRQQEQFDQQVQMVNMLNTLADTLNKIHESMGATAIVSPSAIESYSDVAKTISQETAQIAT